MGECCRDHVVMRQHSCTRLTSLRLKLAWPNQLFGRLYLLNWLFILFEFMGESKSKYSSTLFFCYKFSLPKRPHAFFCQVRSGFLFVCECVCVLMMSYPNWTKPDNYIPSNTPTVCNTLQLVSNPLQQTSLDCMKLANWTQPPAFVLCIHSIDIHSDLLCVFIHAPWATWDIILPFSVHVRAPSLDPQHVTFAIKKKKSWKRKKTR